jgi:hypothetical protein
LLLLLLFKYMHDFSFVYLCSLFHLPKQLPLFVVVALVFGSLSLYLY